VAVRVRAPETPATVTVKVPVAAEGEALKVSVEDAPPPAGGVTGLALKLAVTPLGRPEALSVTAALKALRLATETVVPPAAPWAMLTAPGEADTAKSGGGGAPPQESNLKEAIRVAQEDDGEYMVVSQKVQSSAGSTLRAA
jgi:hypothetical protein